MTAKIITIAMAAILASIPHLALANLGDTMQASVLKYGPASGSGSPQILAYRTNRMRIWQIYDASGHCVIAEFSPLDHAAPFSSHDCAELDRNNLPKAMIPGIGPGWKKVPWHDSPRGRHMVSYQYTDPDDGTLYQVIVGESRDDDNGDWRDDRIYLNGAGIKVFKSFGKAQATPTPAGYQPDSGVQHLELSNGESVVGYTSALDGQWYHVSEEQYAQAQAEGVKLGRELANRAAQGLPPQSLDDSRVEVAGDGMKIFGRDAHYVKFYIDTAIQSAGNEMERLNTLLATRGTRLNNADATEAMDRLQDAKGLPRVEGGVWYDVSSDTYNWIGPKSGRQMSEPAVQFLVEVQNPPGYPPSVSQADTEWARANAARIQAENAKRAATLDPEAMERAAHDAAIRADNEKVLRALQQQPSPSPQP
jgi:hypothetical protein